MIPADASALAKEFLGEEIEIHPELGPELPHDKLIEFATALKKMGYGFFVYTAATHFPATKTTEEYILVAHRVRRLGRNTQSVPFCIKTAVDVPVPSLTGVYVGADWQEREQFDLVGVLFDGHPDLRRIMMPEDWPGHPLRRDYAIETAHFPWR